MTNKTTTAAATAGSGIYDEVIQGMLTSAIDLPALHRKKREEFFSRNLPFYTCVNEKRLWSKEMPTGEVYLVERHYLPETDEIDEKEIKRLK